MSAAERILEWAATRPNWMRHALGVLARRGAVSNEEIGELVAMVRNERGLDPGREVAECVPLSADDLPSDSTPGTTLSLRGLGDVRSVGKLKSDLPLSFAPSGLTIVYGDNGSGKSGYAGVVKRACRARASSALLGDVFANESAGKSPAQAKFSICWTTSDGKETAEDIEWKDDSSPPPASLGQVRVFDAPTAALFVGSDLELAYVPMNLDLLESAVVVLDAMRAQLTREKDANDKRRADLLGAFVAGSRARVYAESITASTDEGAVLQAASWNADTDGRELAKLESELQAPALLAKRSRELAARISSTCSRLAALERALFPEAVATYREAAAQARAAREAAELLSASAFAAEPLPGVGGAPWRLLWDAARRYSSEAAYKDATFPVIDADGARCVLCQQGFDESARVRMRRFDAFVRGDVARRVSNTEAEVRKHLETVEGQQVEDDDGLLASELASEHEPLAEGLTALLTDVEQLQALIVDTLRGSVIASALPTPDWTRTSALRDLAAALEADAEKALSVTSPAERAQKQARIAELLERRALSERVQSLRDLRIVATTGRQLQECMNDLSPAPVTRAMKPLNDDFVSQPFRNALDSERDRLGVEHQVTLGFTVARGTTLHSLKFNGCEFRALSRVLSEGEQRAIALACFLAEVSQVPGASPVVIDDPVSSLDHVRRSLVATRLVSEAQRRQVIVFTHDLVFHDELREAAAELRVPVRHQSLIRGGVGCGRVMAAPKGPWIAMDVDDRLCHLRETALPSLRKLHGDGDAAYASEARLFSEQLREAWERTVEERLFGKVVVRYRNSVMTQRLEDVVVDDSDWAAIHWGMTRVSARCHDTALAVGSAAPSPSDLAKDMEELSTYLAKVKQRRKETQARRAALKDPPPG